MSRTQCRPRKPDNKAHCAAYLSQPQTSSAYLRNSKHEKQACSIAEILSLRLHYQVPWPLSLIVDDTVLLQYNQVLLFLLQV